MKFLTNIKIIAIAILISMICCLGHQIYLFSTGRNNIMKAALFALLIYIYLIRLAGKKIENKLFGSLEKKYSDIIPDSFSARPEVKRIQLKAIYYSVCGKYNACFRILKKLAPKCSTAEEYKSVMIIAETCAEKVCKGKNTADDVSVNKKILAVYSLFNGDNTEKVFLYKHISNIYYNSKDYENCILYAHKALNISPDSYDMYFALVMSYLYINDTANAVKYYNIIREKDPEFSKKMRNALILANISGFGPEVMDQLLSE